MEVPGKLSNNIQENEASSSRGFLRQTQTQHRLPSSYYGGQRIYKMASTGDLVIQGSGESRAGDRRSHRSVHLQTDQNYFLRLFFAHLNLTYFLVRFATREERGSRGELTAAVRSDLKSTFANI